MQFYIRKFFFCRQFCWLFWYTVGTKVSNRIYLGKFQRIKIYEAATKKKKKNFVDVSVLINLVFYVLYDRKFKKFSYEKFEIQNFNFSTVPSSFNFPNGLQVRINFLLDYTWTWSLTVLSRNTRYKIKNHRYVALLQKVLIIFHQNFFFFARWVPIETPGLRPAGPLPHTSHLNS